MKIWSVVSQKGGAGKTTLALQLAIAASEQLKVLLIDLDPQESAERWHQIRQRITGTKDDPSIAAGLPPKLSDMLKTARKLGADLVLIDTPPKRERAIHAAVVAAGLVLVPLRSSVLDLQALKDTADELDVTKCKGKAVVVANAMPSGRNRDGAIKDIMRYATPLKLEVLAERLSDLPAYSQGLKSGRGVTEIERNGTAAKEITTLLEALWARDSEVAAA